MTDEVHVGVLGSGIGHSLSPLLHKVAMELLDVQGTSRIFDVPDAAAATQVMARLRTGELHGLSVTTPFKPLLTNLAGMPKTVSEPNQVAKVVVTIMARGRCRPATAKSAELLTRLAASKPMAMVISK